MYSGGQKRLDNRQHRSRNEIIFPFFISLLQNSCPPTSELFGSPEHLFWDPMKVHDIRWNFEKFLVGPDGVPVMRWFHHTPVRIVQSDIMEYLNQTSTQ
jgi:glutathione peroxidase